VGAVEQSTKLTAEVCPAISSGGSCSLSQKTERLGPLEQTLKMCSVSFIELARNLRVPTLVLGQRIIKLACGHEIPQEMPEQTAALVEAFLSGMGQAAGVQAAA
jgi:hypothetical protein